MRRRVWDCVLVRRKGRTDDGAVGSKGRGVKGGWFEYESRGRERRWCGLLGLGKIVG